MTHPHEVFARSADARLRAVAPEIYRDGRLNPSAWGGIRKFGVAEVEPDMDAGFAARWRSYVTIDPDVLDFLLSCAERLAAQGGDAPTLGADRAV